MIILLMSTLIIPLCGVIVWFLLANHKSDELYERELEKIYARKRKK